MEVYIIQHLQKVSIRMFAHGLPILGKVTLSDQFLHYNESFECYLVLVFYSSDFFRIWFRSRGMNPQRSVRETFGQPRPPLCSVTPNTPQIHVSRSRSFLGQIK